MNVNFAERAHNHNWKLDPIVRSLLDTDFYKLLMLQFIWKNFPTTHVTSEVHNRTTRVRLADAHLRRRPLATRWSTSAASASAVQRTRLARRQHLLRRQADLRARFLAWLDNDFRLSDYEINEHDGQLILRFSGLWTEVTMWEVYSLAIVSEMKTRAALATLNEMELDVLYARAKTRLWDKIELLRPIQGLRLSDFGTRRRHSFLWQEYCVQALQPPLNQQPSERFTGTSNTSLAYKHDLEAIGTNAHELPMAMAALASHGTDDDLRASQYKVLELWRRATTTSSSSCCPTPSAPPSSSKARPTGSPTGPASASTPKTPSSPATNTSAGSLSPRPGPAHQAPHRLRRPRRLHASSQLHDYFDGRIRFSAGWGTLLTNDFRGCHPRGEDTFEPISLVCKLTSADGIPTVKLSDNPSKATGPADLIARYRRVFNTPVQAEIPVLV